MYTVKSNLTKSSEQLSFSQLHAAKVYVVTTVPAGHCVNEGEFAVVAMNSLAFLNSQQHTSDTKNYRFRELRDGETVTITG